MMGCPGDRVCGCIDVENVRVGLWWDEVKCILEFTDNCFFWLEMELVMMPRHVRYNN